MSKTAIKTDLSKHLDQKIKMAIEDFVDLCSRMDVDDHDMLVQIVTLCSHYMALAAIEMEVDEQDYLKVCRYQYHKGAQDLHARRQHET